MSCATKSVIMKTTAQHKQDPFYQVRRKKAGTLLPITTFSWKITFKMTTILCVCERLRLPYERLIDFNKLFNLLMGGIFFLDFLTLRYNFILKSKLWSFFYSRPNVNFIPGTESVCVKVEALRNPQTILLHTLITFLCFPADLR